MNLSGHRFLLLLFLICLPFNGVNSGIIGNPTCQDDEYYDEERDVCLDDCGGLRCAVEQICSDRVDGYEGQRACKEKCFEDCDIMEFCNSKTARCDLCSSICSDLRKCRRFCYDVFRILQQTTSYTSMEVTTRDATPADSTTTSEATHLNNPVIAASISILVLVILALAGVAAVVIYRRKNSRSNRGQETQMLPTDGGETIPNHGKYDSSVLTNDSRIEDSERCDGELSDQETTTTPLLQTDRGESMSHSNKDEVDVRIVKSVRTDEELVTVLHQTLQSRQVLAQTEIRKAEIGYRLVNYLQQCDHENLETARQEMNHVLQGPVVDLNQLQATARKHTIDTFTSDSEESILKRLLTKNAVRVEGSEAVETPDLLMMHGHVSSEQATAIIQGSNCKCLCLFSEIQTGLDSHLIIPKHLEELHLHQYLGQVETLKTIADASTLRALTGVLYFTDRTKIILEHIMQMPSLQALGFQLSQYVHEDQCNMLWKSLQKKDNITCLTLSINPVKTNEIELLVNIISNVEFLQELWLSFLIKPKDSVLEKIADAFCQKQNINTISLVSEEGPVNVAPFLNVIGENNNASTVYTDHDTSQLPALFLGKLVRVRSGVSSCFFTPLMYSRFLLTSIPHYIKKDLFDKYVSRSD